MKVCTMNRKGKEREILILDQDEKKKRVELKNRLSRLMDFPDCVFSFIKGKCAKEATEIVKKYINNYNYFIKCDIEKFYSSINIFTLINRIEDLTKDYNLTYEIKNVLLEEKNKCDIRGLSLGSPLSPILSNLYMLSFDNYFNNNKGLKYIRFCDDMMFLADENIIDEVVVQLDKINLKLSNDKTYIGMEGDSIEYLGQTIFKARISSFNGNTYKKINYDNIIHRYDYENLKNLINSCGKAEFLDTIEMLDSCELNEEDIEKLLVLIEQNLGIVYAYLFRYFILYEDKNELMENLMENTDYKSAYEFNSLIMELNYKNEKYDKIKEVFQGRTGEYYVSLMNKNKDYVRYNGSLDNSIIHKHIDGEISVAIRLDREDSTSRILVFDLDSKNEEAAKALAEDIKQALNIRGYSSFIEYSGKKGYHVWVFFEEFIPVYDLNILAQEIIKNNSSEQVNVEIIPRSNYITETQNIIKLPLGIHTETLKKCDFIDIDNLEELEFNNWIFREEDITDCIDEVKENFKEAYKILNKCSVLKNIVCKGISKKQMCHFERLLVLYVFAHINNGNEFIHYVMEKMDNYSYNITEKYINNAPESPISCRKIREYYKNSDIITKCTCKFILQQGGYSTPVMHCKDREFIRISLENSIQEILKEFAKLKAERKEIDKKLEALDRKLNSLFNTIKSDEINIELGNLKRVKKDENIKWVIELKI